MNSVHILKMNFYRSINVLTYRCKQSEKTKLTKFTIGMGLYRASILSVLWNDCVVILLMCVFGLWDGSLSCYSFSKIS